MAENKTVEIVARAISSEPDYFPQPVCYNGVWPDHAHYRMAEAILTALKDAGMVVESADHIKEMQDVIWAASDLLIENEEKIETDRDRWGWLDYCLTKLKERAGWFCLDTASELRKDTHVFVPRAPTEAMVKAGVRSWFYDVETETAMSTTALKTVDVLRDVFKAMIKEQEDE